MLRNPDGSEYNVSGSLQQFDPESPDHCLFNLWDQEAIEIGGSPIFYYEMFIQTQTLDPILREDRGKIFSNNPIQLFGFYDVQDSQHYQNMFGIEGMEDIVLEFNYKAVVDAIGHPPKVGSRLYTPHKRENWKIVQLSSAEHAMWGSIRLKVFCSKFQESTTTGEGQVSSREPDFKIDDIG